jgi:excisionase family DNA binding protein
MPKSQETLTTRQFAEKAGVSTATVSKWLRDGTIDGRKSGGRWRVPADQLDRLAAPSSGETRPAGAPARGGKTGEPAPAGKKAREAYSLEAFSAMTYLTPYGVERWLKEGRLKGTRDDAGNWRVDASNLDDKAVQRMLRK